MLKRRKQAMNNAEVKKIEEVTGENIKMSTPWQGFYRKIEAMFEKDPEVTCRYDDDKKKISLLVDSQAKAEAIDKILPYKKDFGGVEVTIEVKPSNLGASIGSIYKTAFAGNPIFNDAFTIEGIYDNPMTFVMFNQQIIQFWNDNLGDPNGNYTTLPQTVAQEIFNGGNGVLFSTVPLSK